MLDLTRISIRIWLAIIIMAFCEGKPNTLLDSILFYKEELWGNAFYLIFVIKILVLK